MDATEIFLRGVWKAIPDEDNLSWVEQLAKSEIKDTPLGDFGSLLKEMIDKGVSPYSIARFAKIIGYETAFGICYHLDDPIASYEGFADNVEELSWGLFLVDEETYEPTESLHSLHETLLSLDPSGREMHPQNK